jgi:hypothetical protein
MLLGTYATRSRIFEKGACDLFKGKVERELRDNKFRGHSFERYKTLVIFNVNTSMVLFRIKQPDPERAPSTETPYSSDHTSIS